MKALVTGDLRNGNWLEVEPESFVKCAVARGFNEALARGALAISQNLVQVTYRYTCDEFAAYVAGRQWDLRTDRIPILGRVVTNPPASARIGAPVGGSFLGVSTTGWDPEIFVTDEKNELIPAFRFLPSKEAPVAWGAKEGVYNDQYARSSIYYDGFQAEFTTAVGVCHGYGMDSVRQGLKGVLQHARNFSPKAKLSLKSVFRVSSNLMDASDDEHVALGCSPSLNVYGKEPLLVENPRLFPYRVAGGHVHFGTLVNADNEASLIKAMDLYCALPCVGLFADIDDPLRREFYGRAGEYRKPEYGLEYRTLSNAWLCSPVIAHGVMNLARRAVQAHAYLKAEEFGLRDEDVQNIINYCDVKEARKVVEKNWQFFAGGMAPIWGNSEHTLKALRTGVLGGVGSIFPEYENVENNWRIGPSQLWARHSEGSRLTWGHHFRAF